MVPLVDLALFLSSVGCALLASWLGKLAGDPNWRWWGTRYIACLFFTLLLSPIFRTNFGALGMTAIIWCWIIGLKPLLRQISWGAGVYLWACLPFAVMAVLGFHFWFLYSFVLVRVGPVILDFRWEAGWNLLGGILAVASIVAMFHKARRFRRQSV
ncbi:hypothetical protein HQ520_13010 [bacterium]|nr:hypothetical protein [bacterium]